MPEIARKYRCRDCFERWDTNKYDSRTCPICGSIDVENETDQGCFGSTAILVLLPFVPFIVVLFFIRL